MPVYVSKDYEGKVESVVLAKSRELAVAYWQGQRIYSHSVEELTADDLKNHPTGVLPILKTKDKEFYHNGRFINLRVVD